MNDQIRINKYIAESGFCSRRAADQLILEGRVEINGKTISEPGTKVNPDKDNIRIDGEVLKPQKKVYYVLNKPSGFITTTSDERDRRKVTDLVPQNPRVFPVGRLDYDTTGVLVLTNDGDFANLLMHPSNKVPREYEVRLDKPLQKEHYEVLLTGVFIDKTPGRFISVKFVGPEHKKVIVMSHEGRNHFVKRMFSKLGYRVKELHRLSYAGIKVTGMRKGDFRQLTRPEIDSINAKYNKK